MGKRIQETRILQGDQLQNKTQLLIFLISILRKKGKCCIHITRIGKEKQGNFREHQ